MNHVLQQKKIEEKKEMEDNLKMGILTVGSPKRRDYESEYGNDVTTIV